MGACSPSYLGGWDRRITEIQEAEVAASHRTTARQPGQQEWDSTSIYQSINQNIREKKGVMSGTRQVLNTWEVSRKILTLTQSLGQLHFLNQSWPCLPPPSPLPGTIMLVGVIGLRSVKKLRQLNVFIYLPIYFFSWDRVLPCWPGWS